MSSVLDQLPVVAAISLGVQTPHGVALVFSLVTNVLPGLFILLCLPALPMGERRFFIFPAFVYFARTLSAQFASVTEGLVATSYFWLLLCLIVFGRLTILRSVMIMLLAAGTVRLHEEMVFLGPLLAASCAMRWPRERSVRSRVVHSGGSLCDRQYYNRCARDFLVQHHRQHTSRPDSVAQYGHNAPPTKAPRRRFLASGTGPIGLALPSFCRCF
jgi:hypothetical protein